MGGYGPIVTAGFTLRRFEPISDPSRLILICAAVIAAGILSWNVIDLKSEARAIAYLEDQGAVFRYEYQGTLGFLRLHKRPIEVFMTRPVNDANAFFQEIYTLKTLRWFGANALVDKEVYSNHLNELSKRGIVIR